ncbi:hypothetical protein P170DRAFT_139946 [Aspergillus steynii IBT 23096]|uniref:Uncharacterized protein n=1 Tax=Aspergillus steynii IBT 23096 TaxID=1392250 RepID=A0A2I2GBL4_9EURO|nr:uncharacterized protein P170DRAFT_139946 [Aspergillus steynii IBT 23096]PLB50245.1 hypothetical protein P170DRAFT_139946 [Aspergillus steynii IBT 23096]
MVSFPLLCTLLFFSAWIPVLESVLFFIISFVHSLCLVHDSNKGIRLGFLAFIVLPVTGQDWFGWVWSGQVQRDLGWDRTHGKAGWDMILRGVLVIWFALIYDFISLPVISLLCTIFSAFSPVIFWCVALGIQVPI